jgi:hypothetical protein
MLAPHAAHFMAAEAIQAERRATAARHRLAATQLRPTSGTPRLRVANSRIAAALTSLVLAVVFGSAVAAAVNDGAAAPSTLNAAPGAGGGAGGAILIR